MVDRHLFALEGTDARGARGDGTRLRGRRLAIGRAAWLALAAPAVAIFVAGVPLHASRLRVTCAATLRDEVDLPRLSEQLVTVVEATMEPETVSLWVRQAAPGEAGRTA